MYFLVNDDTLRLVNGSKNKVKKGKKSKIEPYYSLRSFNRSRNLKDIDVVYFCKAFVRVPGRCLLLKLEHSKFELAKFATPRFVSSKYFKLLHLRNYSLLSLKQTYPRE